MRIPESKIEEIRNAANVVDIISEYVPLRKRGKNYIGLCPFHNEKTPSFTVSDDKQIFHCFGCHAGGNVFKFIMDYKKISFVESIQELAEQLGITLEYDEGTSPEKQSEQEELYDINTEAARYFSNNLLNDPEGEIARQYFQNRNIKPQILRAFGLGYALNGWENLINYLKQKNIDFEKALQLGLIGRNNDGRLHDKLAGRIIFPIFSPNGRVVAFAGRILGKDAKGAKYINSPESIIYVKGRILYGLSHAKDEIRRLNKAILVEGYMDLISLYQSGIKNVVAVSGTALTDDQAQLLSRYTKNVVLIFDADAAGIKASMRSIEILLKKDFDIKIATLPKGEDPDSYVQKFGKDEFEEIIKSAENFLEYQTEYYENQGMFNDPTTTVESIRDLVKPVALIEDELKRTVLIKNISKKFNLREKLIETELIQAISVLKKQTQTKTNQFREQNILPKDIFVDHNKKTASPIVYNLEKEVIKVLFDGDNKVLELLVHHIRSEDFIIEINERIFERIKDIYDEGGDLDPANLIAEFEDEDIQAYLREITIADYSISPNWDEYTVNKIKETSSKKYVTDLIIKLKQVQIEEQIKNNRKLIDEAESPEAELNLLRMNNELESEKRRIKEELSK
ncbi:MAG TPA: DNA primase [Ignavibacteriaceae bacterium]|nr:DNA primase [Ignavibacteriaceae bacterium]